MHFSLRGLRLTTACRHFYSPAQYIGALIVLGGLFVSVLPAFLASAKTAGAGPPMFDLVL